MYFVAKWEFSFQAALFLNFFFSLCFLLLLSLSGILQLKKLLYKHQSIYLIIATVQFEPKSFCRSGDFSCEVIMWLKWNFALYIRKKWIQTKCIKNGRIKKKEDWNVAIVLLLESCQMRWDRVFIKPPQFIRECALSTAFVLWLIHLLNIVFATMYLTHCRCMISVFFPFNTTTHTNATGRITAINAMCINAHFARLYGLCFTESIYIHLFPSESISMLFALHRKWTYLLKICEQLRLRFHVT